MSSRQQPSGSEGFWHLPEVQLIGAQKAGTSAIADWLFENGGFGRPKVFHDEPWYYSKEVHFFDLRQRHVQGVEFYAKRFVGPSARYLDATPDTLPFPDRVRSTYLAAGGNQVDNVKFIAIIREPISRELSLYNHLAFDCKHLSPSERNEWHNQVLDAENGMVMSFDDFVQERSIPALARESGPGQSTRHSLYAKHLSKWFQLFDRNQILLLNYGELQRNPTKVQERIQHFLKLEIPGSIPHSNVLDNPLKLKAPSSAAKKALAIAFKPLNDTLYQLLESNPGPEMEEVPLRFESYC
eukprot:scaffold2277_cov137-Cylindrotheca_fusiformis.AAC.16